MSCTLRTFFNVGWLMARFFAARASAAASSEPGGGTRAAPDAADFADFDLLVLLVVPMVRDRREWGRGRGRESREAHCRTPKFFAGNLTPKAQDFEHEDVTRGRVRRV